METLITNVRPGGGDPTNLRIVDGTIIEAGLELTSQEGATVIDGRNDLLLPAFVEPHVHFDKTLWGLPWHGHHAGLLLVDRINYEREYLAGAEIDPGPQAAAAIRQAVVMRSLYIRSHADVTPELGIQRIEALAAVRDDFVDEITADRRLSPTRCVRRARNRGATRRSDEGWSRRGRRI